MCREQLHGTWRGSGSSSFFGLYGLSGSVNETNQINQTHLINFPESSLAGRLTHLTFIIQH